MGAAMAGQRSLSSLPPLSFPEFSSPSHPNISFFFVIREWSSRCSSKRDPETDMRHPLRRDTALNDNSTCSPSAPPVRIPFFALLSAFSRFGNEPADCGFGDWVQIWCILVGAKWWGRFRIRKLCRLRSWSEALATRFLFFFFVLVLAHDKVWVLSIVCFVWLWFFSGYHEVSRFWLVCLHTEISFFHHKCIFSSQLPMLFYCVRQVQSEIRLAAWEKKNLLCELWNCKHFVDWIHFLCFKAVAVVVSPFPVQVFDFSDLCARWLCSL